MTAAHIDPLFRALLIAGVVLYLSAILWMLKKNKLTVRYSIIWLLSGLVFAVFAVCPYIVLVLRDWTQIETVANLVFILVIGFMLLLLLSLSSIVSGQAEKLKRMAQKMALLERRVRELEEQAQNGKKS